MLHKVKLPVEGITACTFGGPKLQDLFITTLNPGDEPKEGVGGLYVARPPGVSGVQGAYFGKLPA